MATSSGIQRSIGAVMRTRRLWRSCRFLLRATSRTLPSVAPLVLRVSPMAKTLPSPPYDDMEEMWRDLPRKALRESLKLVGLPASYEVGILGHAAQRLRTKLEKTHNIHIDDAVFTGSHLAALYQDDLEDVAAFLKIHYFTPNWQFRPFVWESASAYAGYGFGLCEHWRDEVLCEKEMEEMENLPVMSVHFTRNALTVAMPVIHAAVMAWEPEAGTSRILRWGVTPL